MQIEHKTLSFSIKSASDNGTFEGYANAFHNIDSAQEIVVPGAFTDTLPQFLSDGFVGNINHGWDSPIGKPIEAREDSVGLYIKAMISNTTDGQNCRILMKDGVIKKMSIGYSVKADEHLEDAEAVAMYWEKWGYKPTPQDIARSQYGARLLLKINPLYECSPVAVPANSLADIARVKRYDPLEITTERQFERFLRDLGVPKDAAVTITSSGFKALLRRDAEETPIEQETILEIVAEAIAEAKAEEKQEETPVTLPTVQKASQEAVHALYAQFLNTQAAYVNACRR